MSPRTEAYASKSTLQEKTASWMADIAKHCAPRTHLKIAIDNAALLVIDMIHYFAHPEGRAFLPVAPVISENINTLAELFRNHARPVIFTQHCHRNDSEIGMMGRFFKDYIRCKSPESDIVAPLDSESGDTVIRKATYDAFWQTDLEERLKEAEASQILIVGLQTHLCCETTARSAFVRGYEVYMAADATAARTEAFHLSALRSMADGVAVVLPTKEIVALCETNE